MDARERYESLLAEMNRRIIRVAYEVERAARAQALEDAAQEAAKLGSVALVQAIRALKDETC